MSAHAPAIVGTGMLARAFARRASPASDLTIFASGVSDSRESRASQFAREAELLETASARCAGRLVYFSCCALAAPGGPGTPYLAHKASMEARVLAAGGLVFRLPQVIGPGGNPHSLARFLHAHIAEGRRFQAWRGAQRNLIDVDHVAAIVLHMAADTQPAALRTVASPFTLPLPALVAIFERITGRKARCTWVDHDDPLPVDASAAIAAATQLGIDFSPGYTERVLRRRLPSPHGDPQPLARNAVDAT